MTLEQSHASPPDRLHELIILSHQSFPVYLNKGRHVQLLSDI